MGMIAHTVVVAHSRIQAGSGASGQAGIKVTESRNRGRGIKKRTSIKVRSSTTRKNEPTIVGLQLRRNEGGRLAARTHPRQHRNDSAQAAKHEKHEGALLKWKWEVEREARLAAAFLVVVGDGGDQRDGESGRNDASQK
jgi:hypothetical protein